MNADEIVRALRATSDANPEHRHGKLCNQAADLIDSLTAQLTASQRREKAAVGGLEYLMANQYDNAWICDHCAKKPAIGETCKECNPEWRGSQEAEKGMR